MSLTYQNISNEIDNIILNNFKIHPFSFGVTKRIIESILSQYLAMSEAFPYLQAASQKKLILNTIQNNKDIEKEIELTSVVGNFLCWDETGGHSTILKYGNKGLTKILDTEKNFHANMLKKDVKKILNKNILPNYTNTIASYLLNLLKGLKSLDHIERCAFMVSFENHVSIMIDSLCKSIVELFKIDKDELIYFKVHVGEDDPAEVYHIEMTERMISEIVPESRFDEFINKFMLSYKLHYDWCEVIKE